MQDRVVLNVSLNIHFPKNPFFHPFYQAPIYKNKRHLRYRQHASSTLAPHSRPLTSNSPNPTFYFLSSLSLSSRRARRSAQAILIQTQPPVTATNLRLIAIARRRTTSRAGRDDLSRLDTLAVGVTAAVAPEKITGSHQSMMQKTPKSQSFFQFTANSREEWKVIV